MPIQSFPLELPDVLVECAVGSAALLQLHAHHQEVVGDDLEHVLPVLAQQHQPERLAVDREPEEALVVGGERVAEGLVPLTHLGDGHDFVCIGTAPALVALEKKSSFQLVLILLFFCGL